MFGNDLKIMMMMMMMMMIRRICWYIMADIEINGILKIIKE